MTTALTTEMDANPRPDNWAKAALPRREKSGESRIKSNSYPKSSSCFRSSSVIRLKIYLNIRRALVSFETTGPTLRNETMNRFPSSKSSIFRSFEFDHLNSWITGQIRFQVRIYRQSTKGEKGKSKSCPSSEREKTGNRSIGFATD